MAKSLASKSFEYCINVIIILLYQSIVIDEFIDILCAYKFGLILQYLNIIELYQTKIYVQNETLQIQEQLL